MPDGITLSGVEKFDDLYRELRETYPAECRRAVVQGVNWALQRTKAKGISISRKEYDIDKEYRGRKAVKARASVKKSSVGVDGEVVFTGGPGVPLRYFRLRPKKPSGVDDLKGHPPAFKRPRHGIRVRVKKSGSFVTVLGPNGRKAFWFNGRSGNRDGGNLVLGYRDGKKISSKGLYGASPIQALGSRENFPRLCAEAEKHLNSRVLHALDRLASKKGFK